jgi:hypothetical protein
VYPRLAVAVVLVFVEGLYFTQTNPGKKISNEAWTSSNNNIAKAACSFSTKHHHVNAHDARFILLPNKSLKNYQVSFLRSFPGPNNTAGIHALPQHIRHCKNFGPFTVAKTGPVDTASGQM